MVETPYRLEYYLDDNGEAPFTKWLEALRDRVAFSRIAVRLDRMQAGNFGVVKALGDGVSELKIDYGPGYRVYYAMSGKRVVLLLIGGDKSTQSRDIEEAKVYWKPQKER
jgi:putative addiction module killer protein